MCEALESLFYNYLVLCPSVQYTHPTFCVFMCASQRLSDLLPCALEAEYVRLEQQG